MHGNIGIKGLYTLKDERILFIDSTNAPIYQKTRVKTKGALL
tara:strand:+ start:160 stop:285 length:126 start_codon:yes stop_codon:yes gene_type:complete